MQVQNHDRFPRWKFYNFFAKILSDVKLAHQTLELYHSKSLFLEDFIIFLNTNLDYLKMKLDTIWTVTYRLI